MMMLSLKQEQHHAKLFMIIKVFTSVQKQQKLIFAFQRNKKQAIFTKTVKSTIK